MGLLLPCCSTQDAGTAGAADGGSSGTGALSSIGGAVAGGGEHSSGGAASGGSQPGSGGVVSSGSGGVGSGGVGSGGAEGTGGTGGSILQPATLVLMDEVMFYDGYAMTVDEPLPEGIVRLTNSLIARKLSPDEHALIASHLQLRVTVGAQCDNYDRIGSVNLAMIPIGGTYDDVADIRRIEVARFITPFMDMNAQPDEVPYEWNIDYVSSVLTDSTLRESYDFWFELSIFGVPYAANEEVPGCDGRNDVFRGSLVLDTDAQGEASNFDVLLPLAVQEAFNSYQAGASDQMGVTRKTIPFALQSAAEEAQLVLITSNHGANSGGEEYIRRQHLVYVDDELVLDYTPGRESCEPFREYNTQANGIYGSSRRSDADWQSFSNWCPGDKIDNRIIPLGMISAGEHTFMIEVPDAQFVGNEGNFPLSLYLQAR